MRNAYLVAKSMFFAVSLMTVAGCSASVVEPAEEGIVSQNEPDCGPPACLEPGDPRIEYIEGTYEDPNICHLIDLRPDFSCGDGRSFFSNECGCGCIDDEPSQCPDPEDPHVHYLEGTLEDPTLCHRVDFRCQPGERMFGGECGCGCISLDD